jgi:hypothetical protein
MSTDSTDEGLPTGEIPEDAFQDDFFDEDEEDEEFPDEDEED